MSLSSPPTGNPSAPSGWDDPWRRWEAAAREPEPKWSVAAVAAVPCALVLSPLGLTLGVIALVRTRDGRRRGRGLAWTAVVISTVWLTVAAIALVMFARSRAERGDDGSVTAAGTSGVFSLQKGDCLQQPPTGGDDVMNVDVTPCTQAHDAQVFAIVRPQGAGAYDLAGIQSEVEGLCTEAAKTSLTTDDAFDLLYFVPAEDAWKSGLHNSVCMLASSTPLTTSVVG